MNQKGGSNIVLMVIVLIVLAGAGGYFFLQKTEIATLPEAQNQQQVTDQVQTTEESTTNNVIVSNYGFSFSIPDGWHLWEGYSAHINLLEKEGDNFVLSYEAGWTPKQVEIYQEFMDSWIPENAKVLVFTDADVDYKTRSFSEAGKIGSTIADSDDMLKLGMTEMIISAGEVTSGEETYKNDEQERGYVSINGVEARYGIGKKGKFVDQIALLLPINSNKYIDGKRVEKLAFIKFIKKDDPNALSKLVSFISEMHITTNP